MDVYILDNLLRRTAVVDDYETLIWTERYKAMGDFELHIRSDRGTRALFTPDLMLVINESYRVMVVETVENTTNDQGVMMLKVTGRSLERILAERVNRRSGFSTGAPPTDDTLTNTPGNLMRYYFNAICRNNTIIPTDNIPYLQPGSLLPPGSIPEPSDPVTMQINVASLYDTLKNIADIYDLGFRLLRNGDLTQLYFDVYTGDDRTTQQTVNANVVFSQDLDDLTDTSELTSVANQRNVAYVRSPNGSRMVYTNGDSSSTSGFAKRILYVEANDITLAAGTALQNALEQRGQEELAKALVNVAFDGEIPQQGPYKYGIDYDLGDLVEQRNADGLTTNMRVTEQIFVCDAQGTRSYPTLETRQLITPGSWLAWDNNQVWSEAVGYWADA